MAAGTDGCGRRAAKGLVANTGASRRLKLYSGPSLTMGGHDLGPPEYTRIDLGIRKRSWVLLLTSSWETMLRVGRIWELNTEEGQLSWG